jgi:two-component system response regulator FlrC
VAQAQVTVLLEGPTGSGKEVLARVLHESSPSQGGPFIGLNCAALPEHMIEDMLFGHEKGAFTGAVKDHRGMFEQAQGGTIFLDEVGDLPIGLQAKLLRVLQERSLVKLGSERAIALDVRVIAATNKNLRLAIERREFREDLYFRLSTFKLRVPPVAERRGDILPLVARVLARHQRDDGVWTVSPAAQACLLSYAWPGNVREIENVVQRAMVLCTDRHIDEHHLMFDDAPDPVGLVAMLQVSTELSCPFEPLTSETKVSVDYREVDLVGRSKLQTVVKQSENHVIRSALETSKNRVEAAQKLGISPRTLRYKLAQLRDHTSAQLASA